MQSYAIYYTMNILEAIILGLTQGFTEFLPVSSSGHLLLVGRFLGVGNVSLGFELVCHVGTLAAIGIVMRRECIALVRHPLSRNMRLLVVATVPTAIIAGVIGLLFRDIAEGSLLVYGFILTGIIIMVGEICAARKPLTSPLSYGKASVIGVAQGVAALPGLSRSGTTMAVATLLGCSREDAARFSFLLSVPVIIGSSIVEIALNGIGSGISAAALIAAAISSFVSGLVAAKAMLGFLRTHSLDGFAVYLLILSAFMLVNDCFLHLF